MLPSAREMAEAELEVVNTRQFNEKIVNEEFKIWKRTVPLLYDVIHTIVLESPSVSALWISAIHKVQDKPAVSTLFVMGTHSSLEGGYLKLGSLELPAMLAKSSAKQNICDPMDISDYSITKKWKQKSLPIIVRTSPNGEIVLSMHQSGIVRATNIMDDDAHNVEYKYHKQEGSFLEWIDDSQFLSGANDWQIALWNVGKPSTPIRLFKTHFGSVNGISSSKQAPSIFGSVSDDYSTLFHDIRIGSLQEPIIKVQNTHIQNSIAIHPEVGTLYVTAGQDNVVHLYDLRNTKSPFRLLFGHNDSVLGCKWDTFHNPLSLFSWALDRRVNIWDLSRLDIEYSYPTDSATENTRKRASKKTDPCLKFVHAGHTQRVNNVDIHPCIPNLYMSVGEDKLLEIWKPKSIQLETESAKNSDLDSSDLNPPAQDHVSDEGKDQDLEPGSDRVVDKQSRVTLNDKHDKDTLDAEIEVKLNTSTLESNSLTGLKPATNDKESTVDAAHPVKPDSISSCD